MIGLLLIAGCSWNKKQDTELHPAYNPLQDTALVSADFHTKLSLHSSASNLQSGKEFSVDLKIDNAKQPVTTVSTGLTFDASMLQIVSIQSQEGKFPLAFREKFDNTLGTLEISRSDSKGITGDNLLVSRVIFKTIKKGDTDIALNPHATMVLMADNANVTPLEKSFEPLKIKIAE